MPRLAHVNGRYLPLKDAAVPVEDRAFLFADGVYEVILALGSRLVDREAHLDRLGRSLMALDIPWPASRRAMEQIMERLVRAARLPASTLYLQVSRGVAPRDHKFPRPRPRPSLVMFVRPFSVPALVARQMRGVRVALVADERWKRCDIKSVSLLANVLAKEQAHRADSFEAWMVDADGRITEGSSSTAFIVDRTGALVTRPLTSAILPGITREVVLALARARQIPVREEAFTAADFAAAREAFLCSTTSGVTPVVAVGGQVVGDGRPGPLTRRLIAAHWAHMARQTQTPIPPEWREDPRDSSDTATRARSAP